MKSFKILLCSFFIGTSITSAALSMEEENVENNFAPSQNLTVLESNDSSFLPNDMLWAIVEKIDENSQAEEVENRTTYFHMTSVSK